MTDLNTVPPPPPPPPEPPPPPPGGPSGAATSPLSDERQIPLINYVLMLAGFFSGWLTPIVALVLAYVNRDTAPDWLKSHYAFQIRTFWLSLGGTVISVPLMFAFGLGFVTWAAVCIWFIVRCAVGLNWLLKSEPYPNPETWLV